MPILWGALLVMVALLAAVFIRARRRYGPMFEDAHFLEIVDAVADLKAAAHSRVGVPIAPPDDPRVRATSAGVVLCYTIEAVRDDGELLHHVSLSHGGGRLAWAAGGRFVHMVFAALGVPVAEVALAHGTTGTVHAAFLVPPGVRELFEHRPVRRSGIQELGRLKQDAGRFMLRAMQERRLLPSEEHLLPALRERTRGH